MMLDAKDVQILIEWAYQRGIEAAQKVKFEQTCLSEGQEMQVKELIRKIVAEINVKG